MRSATVPLGVRPRSATSRVLAAATLLLGAAACRGARPEASPTRAPSPAEVVARLERRIAEVPGAQVAVSVRDLDSGRRLSLRGDTLFHAASTMKVPVLFALYQAFRAGTMPRDRTIPLRNRFTSIVDGSAYALDAREDSDSSVYALVGTDVSVRYLARRMITHSSNLATNAVIELLDPQRITSLTRELGATQLLVRRGVEDDLAYRAGLNNVTTADDLVAIFAALAEGRVGSEADTREMLEILEAQAFNDEIPAGLPPGTRVAHKTGSITATWHDAGLVYPPGRKPYAIAILTRNIPDERVAQRLMADCSRIVWQWLHDAR